MQQNKRHFIRKSLIVLLSGGVILFIGHELEHHLPELGAWIQTMGAFAPLGFIGLFVILAPIFVSVDLLCFAAGFLFPIIAGAFYTMLATYLASALIFFLGRYLLRHRVHAFIAEHQRFAALNAAISGENAFKLMFVLRLIPLPFAMLSYALSITQVGFWSYLAATSGILIYNCSLVYFGYTTRNLSGLISGSMQPGSVSYPLLGAGILITLLILIYIAKIANSTITRLTEKTDSGSC